MQARALEQEALTLRAQAPFMEGDPPSAAAVLAEFDVWLISGAGDVPTEAPRDRAQRDLDEAMGVRRQS